MNEVSWVGVRDMVSIIGDRKLSRVAEASYQNLCENLLEYF